MVYNKDKHMQLELQNFTKKELKKIAKKDRRSVNTFINVAIEEKVKRIEDEHKLL